MMTMLFGAMAEWVRTRYEDRRGNWLDNPEADNKRYFW